MLRPPRPASLLANIRRAWRRSLQLRVITITVVSTGVLVLIFGLVVSKLITDGLVSTREAAAKEVVQTNSDEAVLLLESQISGVRDPFGSSKIQNVVRTLSRADGGVALAILPEPTADPTGGQLTLSPAPPLPPSFPQAVPEQGFSQGRMDL